MKVESNSDEDNTTTVADMLPESTEEGAEDLIGAGIATSNIDDEDHTFFERSKFVHVN